MRRRIHLGLEGHVAVLVKIADLFLGVRGEPRGVRDKWRAGAAGGDAGVDVGVRDVSGDPTLVSKLAPVQRQLVLDHVLGHGNHFLGQRLDPTFRDAARAFGHGGHAGLVVRRAVDRFPAHGTLRVGVQEVADGVGLRHRRSKQHRYHDSPPAAAAALPNVTCCAWPGHLSLAECVTARVGARERVSVCACACSSSAFPARQSGACTLRSGLRFLAGAGENVSMRCPGLLGLTPGFTAMTPHGRNGASV